MRSVSTMLAVLLMVGAARGGQQGYLPSAQTERRNGLVTVSANDPRPLWQAISALRREYGWVVDYEEPLWPSSDLRDVSPAAWRAAHPGETGWLVPAGGAFQSSFPAEPDMWGSAKEELQVLDKVVTDYDASGNPGQFIVRAEPDGSYAIIGFAAGAPTGGLASTPLLDTAISLKPESRSAANTVILILSALSVKSGVPVRLGYGPINLMHQTPVNVGGSDVPASALLMELFQAMRVKASWDLWYEPNLKSFLLRILPAAREVPGMFGRR